MDCFRSSSWGLSQAGGRPVLGGGMSQSTLALVACDSSSSSPGFPKRQEEIQAKKKGVGVWVGWGWGGNSSLFRNKTKESMEPRDWFTGMKWCCQVSDLFKFLEISPGRPFPSPSASCLIKWKSVPGVSELSCLSSPHQILSILPWNRPFSVRRHSLSGSGERGGKEIGYKAVNKTKNPVRWF